MGKSALSSWPQRTILYLIGLYQRHISAHTPPSCRFTPTCSQYASEAIKRFGVWRGGRLALWRLCRCQPFCRGGYDPVPALPEPALPEPALPEPLEAEDACDHDADES